MDNSHKTSDLQERGFMHLDFVLKGVRGAFRDIILFTIYELREAHGYTIKLYIANSLGLYVPSSGILYPTLHRLEREGFISSRLEGRRRVYKLTPKGEEYVKSKLEELRKIIYKARRAFEVACNIGLLELIGLIKELWERDIEVPSDVLAKLKVKVDEINAALKELIESKRANHLST
jgi:DNA-binding PadR family transcriptional regulator